MREKIIWQRTQTSASGNTTRSDFGKDNLKWVDKKKALGYISVSAPIAEAQYKQELDSATKVIKEFKNPVIAGENNLESEIVTKAVGADGRPIKVYNANTARREEWDDESGVKFSAGILDWRTVASSARPRMW